MIGFLVGSALGGTDNPKRPENHSAAEPTTPAGRSEEPVLLAMDSLPTESPTGQRTILIIGIDELQAPVPSLKSVWVLFYIPSSPGMTLVPLYPAMSNNQTEPDAALAASFALTPEKTPAQSFVDALDGKDVHWSHYAVLDAVGLAALIDTLGGVDISADHLDGNSVVAGLSAIEADTVHSLESQSDLIKGLCAIPGRPGVVIDVPAIFNLLNGHLSTNITADLVISDWNSLGMLGGQLCKFPTLHSSY